MEQNKTMPVAQATPQAVAMPAQPPKKKDHWMVEVAGGVTLGSTIMAALSLWAVMVANILMS